MQTNPRTMGIVSARVSGMPIGRFNSEMLVTAREAQFLTQAGLAEKIGVRQPVVGKWEAGLSVPGEAQIDGLAAALGVLRDMFFIDRPRRLASMSDFYHRSLAKAKRLDVKAIHARCNIVDLQVDRLLQIAAPREDRVPDIDPDNHAGNVEKIAAMARVAMGVGAGPIENLIDVIEGCGGIVIDRQLEVDDVDALCRWVPGLPKLFFVNGARSADRMRFSLAHELGHTIMHFGRDYDHRTAEDQANSFASAFLMPAQDIRRDLGPALNLAGLAAIKRKWRVSMQAIARRARDLGAIDETRYTSIYVQMSRNGWRKSEPVELARESAREFARLLRMHIEAGYTTSDLSHLLFVPGTTIHEMLVDASSPTWATDGVRMRLAR